MLGPRVAHSVLRMTFTAPFTVTSICLCKLICYFDKESYFESVKMEQIHFETTGPEIWEDTNGKVDIFVMGIGSGGTVTGVGQYLKSKNPNIQVKIYSLCK